MQTLKITTDTVLKRKPVPSGVLPDTEKHAIAASTELKLHSFNPERDHLKVALAQDKFQGFNTWYAFGDHAQILSNGRVIVPKPKPPVLKLSVPYKSQLDNEENPTGSCNVTSIAMCLEFLGIQQKTGLDQFEDELYQYAIAHGLSRHDPQDLATIVRAYGCRDDFRTNATISKVQDWLTDGNPVVTHGYFTSFGHIIAIVGFDAAGFWVHDPYGEWTSNGYRTDLSGKYLHYSYKLITALCIPDGNFWVHFISR